MNGDFKERTLDEWIDETFPGLREEWEVHGAMLVEDIDARASMIRHCFGSLRVAWWAYLPSHHDNLLKRIKELEYEREKLMQQNRNLRKRLRKQP